MWCSLLVFSLCTVMRCRIAGSGTLCGIHTYVGEPERTICGIRAGELDVTPVRGIGNTHILVSIFTVNRYTYPGLLNLLLVKFIIKC